MKICPRCQKTYADDDLNFCLEDGSVLTQAAGAKSTPFLSEPPITYPTPQVPGQRNAQQSWPAPQPAQQYAAAQTPAKSSKTWIWVLLILGMVVLLCGGGFAAFLLYVGTQANNMANMGSANTKIRPLPSNTRTNTSNSASNSNSDSGSTKRTTAVSERSSLETIDLSTWEKEFSAYGTTEMIGDELVMASKQKGFYYAVVSLQVYSTENANTSVTLRNVDNASGDMGYGLIFHSDPTPLQKDYAFLIDTKRKKYRVVYHTPRKETPVINWTSSDAIREGSAENTLEVRDFDDKIELHINGILVTTIKDVYGYADGVPGLYAGDGVKVGFKNLEIRK